MGRRAAGLEAAALVDGDVDHARCPGFIAGEHLAGDQLGRARPAPAPRRSRGRPRRRGSIWRAVGMSRSQRPPKMSCRSRKASGILVEDRDVGPHADGDLRGWCRRRRRRCTTTSRRLHARHAAEQDARARPRSPGGRADLDGHAARHLAHRREQRQGAVGICTVS